MFEYKEGLIPGFTKEYGLKLLVYYEEHASAAEASARERQMKAWKRDWKKQVSEDMNRDWADLADRLNV